MNNELEGERNREKETVNEQFCSGLLIHIFIDGHKIGV